MEILPLNGSGSPTVTASPPWARYSYRGRPVLMAWGFVDEKHCRHHAVHCGDGWSTVVDGCPDVRFDDGFQVRTPGGGWLLRA